MQVELQPTQEDYNKFLKSLYFQKDFGKRLFLLVDNKCGRRRRGRKCRTRRSLPTLNLPVGRASATESGA
jgi:hypothetical protein